MSHRRCLIGFIGVSLLIGMVGCASEDFTGEEFTNEAPTVWISGGPSEGGSSSFEVHLYWGGWDPDGEISRYEYLMTDNEGGLFDPADTLGAAWNPVFRNDSIFTVRADQLADSATVDWQDLASVEFRRSHTFFIRSVDDHGRRSREPANLSFTAKSLSPLVHITVPRRTGLTPAQVPPVVTFRWAAKAFTNHEYPYENPEWVRWILLNTQRFDSKFSSALEYIRMNPDAPEWSDWHPYNAPNDSGTFWTSNELDHGAYMFAVQVKDRVGAVNPMFDEEWNVRRLTVTDRTTGPKLTVFNKYFGYASTSTTTSSVPALDLPSGTPMQFEWMASAESYGGLVAGYRYGWDVIDFRNDDEWEVTWTPFIAKTAFSVPRTFYFGTHMLWVEARDNSGYKSRVGVQINYVPFTMERDLLLVDDWQEGSGGWITGGIPSDAEHDAFWLEMLRDLIGFTEADVYHLQGGVREVPIRILAQYRSVIWSAYGVANTASGSELKNVIAAPVREPGLEKAVAKDLPPRLPNSLSSFMRAGGRVLLCGNQIMSNAIYRGEGGLPNPRFPVIFRYELGGDQDGRYQDSQIGVWGVGENSFAYNDCCLNVLDAVSMPGQSIRRHPDQPWPYGCPVNGTRTYDIRTDGLRSCIPVDSLTGGGFPTLELRPEATAPGRIYNEDSRGLNADIYNPAYFYYLTRCGRVAEYVPPRECFQPIYGLDCLDDESLIHDDVVAFWTSKYADRVAPNGTPGRSAVWGFHPVYFKPDQVRKALEIVLFDEWKLSR